MNFYTKEVLWQTENWKNFQQHLGYEVFQVEKDNIKINIICKELLFGKTFLEIQRANLTKGLWLEIEKIAQSKNAIFCRISPNSKSLPEFLLKKYVITKAHRFPELTSVIDLLKSEEEILASMSQSGRRHIRAAQKAEVQIVESDDISSFAKILKETTSRQGFSGHNENYYKKLLENFGSDAFLLLAKINDEVIAGGIFVYSKDICTYYYGASSDENREAQAPTLLQWQAILKAKKDGKKYFDFLGIAPIEIKNHPWSGVSQFKRKFGGDEIDYASEVEIPFSKLWYYLFQLVASLRKILK